MSNVRTDPIVADDATREYRLVVSLAAPTVGELTAAARQGWRLITIENAAEKWYSWYRRHVSQTPKGADDDTE